VLYLCYYVQGEFLFSGSGVMNNGARRIPKTLFSVLFDTTRSCDDEIDLLIIWLSIYLMETRLPI
jgi:hypothetical protein